LHCKSISLTFSRYDCLQLFFYFIHAIWCKPILCVRSASPSFMVCSPNVDFSQREICRLFFSAGCLRLQVLLSFGERGFDLTVRRLALPLGLPCLRDGSLPNPNAFLFSFAWRFFEGVDGRFPRVIKVGAYREGSRIFFFPPALFSPFACSEELQYTKIRSHIADGSPIQTFFLFFALAPVVLLVPSIYARQKAACISPLMSLP